MSDQHARLTIRDDLKGAMEAIFPAGSIYYSPRLAQKNLPSCLIWVTAEPIENVAKDEQDTTKNRQRRVTGVNVAVLVAKDMVQLETYLLQVERAVANLKQMKSPDGYHYTQTGTTFSVSDQLSSVEFIEGDVELQVSWDTHEDDLT